MARNAIEVSGASKRYLLGEDRPGASLQEKLARSAARFGKRGGVDREVIWALRDIDLTVADGHSLGVIGRNGSGKSTLLKLLSRITEPTMGIVRTRGRVAALLEIGTGFHSELTGRENVYLNGAILGMGRRDIARRFDDIVSFAGMSRFIDTPVKRYSSGMYLRLAFSVAAHLEPDIMVVDEVLAVGDAEFQARCLNRMEGAEREGRTVVFVSHNLTAISQLCERSIWLDHGAIQKEGLTEAVVGAYLRTLASRPEVPRDTERAKGPVVVRSVRILDHTGHPADVVQESRPFLIEVTYSVGAQSPGLDLAAFVQSMRAGVEALNEAWSDTVSDRNCEPGDYVARLEVPPVLNVDDYVIGVWFGTAYETFVLNMAATRVRVEGDSKRSKRIVKLGLPWKVEFLGPTQLPETDTTQGEVGVSRWAGP
jgi:ABC-type polysaccharide/polyol phosphate transport system ATPase subunit